MGSLAEKRTFRQREVISFNGGSIYDLRPFFLTEESWSVLLADLDLGQHGKKEGAVINKWPNHSVSDEKMVHEARTEISARTNLGQSVSNFVAREVTTQEAIEAGILAPITKVTVRRF